MRDTVGTQTKIKVGNKVGPTISGRGNAILPTAMYEDRLPARLRFVHMLAGGRHGIDIALAKS
jgi:hypothetical protein